MSPQLIIAAVIAALSFGGGWTLQSWRYGARETKRAQQQLADERLAAATAVRRLDNSIQAQDAAVVRERNLRADAANSRGVLDGLRVATASTLRAAESAHSACIERTATLGELLNQCGAEYQGLGEKADRHASDVKTLMDAWPK